MATQQLNLIEREKKTKTSKKAKVEPKTNIIELIEEYPETVKTQLDIENEKEEIEEILVNETGFSDEEVKTAWNERVSENKQVNHLTDEEYTGKNLEVLTSVQKKQGYKSNRWLLYTQLKEMKVDIKGLKRSTINSEFIYNLDQLSLTEQVPEAVQVEVSEKAVEAVVENVVEIKAVKKKSKVTK